MLTKTKYKSFVFQTLPEEVYNNEEVATMIRVLRAPNNKIKKFPPKISSLSALNEVDVRNNAIGTMNISPGLLLLSLQKVDNSNISKNYS